MKRSKAPSALAAKKARTDETVVKKSETITNEAKPKTETPKDSQELYHSSTPTPPSAPASTVSDTENIPPKIPLNKPGGFRTPFKSPVTSATKVIAAKKVEASEELKESVIYTVLWCNFTNKKHKSWNDGTFYLFKKQCNNLLIIRKVYL
jgi:hypothetical protein